MSIKVKVTKEHIKRGSPKFLGYCPVALALNERLKIGHFSAYSVEVRQTQTLIHTKHHCIMLENPNTVRNFIHNYDLHEKGDEFQFEFTKNDVVGPYKCVKWLLLQYYINMISLRKWLRGTN